jgi:hypothetical protein
MRASDARSASGKTVGRFGSKFARPSLRFQNLGQFSRHKNCPGSLNAIRKPTVYRLWVKRATDPEQSGFYDHRMNPFDLTVEHEIFRISERRQPNGALSHDLLWINGPADGTYGFTVGRSTPGPGGIISDDAARMTGEELVVKARGFVEHVCEPGGVGETWPEHVPARDLL